MAMREGTRRFVIRVACVVLIVAVSLLVGLRIGRPNFYTDGQAEVPARALAAAGMLRWQTPEVQVELPGPVQGRVAMLPGGRLVYGRSQADGTTDLVVWDPARPAVPPEPAYGLNTEHNELAPALGPDGKFYFASDRPDGVGGYDLYVAQWGEAGFGRPVPLAACNTALDESDPAPCDNGQDFVFVRIDRAQDHGNSGVLYRWRVADPFDPAPVFAAEGGRRYPQPIDRDPAFAPGGGALWFVRKVRAEPLRLVRASLCAGVFDAPLPVGESWGTGELRAPMPMADGVHLGLLQPRRSEATTDLWFQATATEVYPWWPGQRWLEWILIGIVASCVLLLLLLHFGRRWSTLDLVAQCLLLSLLLHILLFLWLMGVEISGTLLRGEDEGSGMEVTVITAAAAAATASGGMQADELAARVQFETEQRALAAAAPATATERAAAAELAGPEAQWSSAAAARDVAASTQVQDAAAAATQRAGQDATATPAATSLQTVDRGAVAANAAQAAQRVGAAAEAVQVVAPDAAVARASHATASLAPVGSLEELPSPSPRAAETAVPALHDAQTAAAAAAAAPRSGRDVVAGAALAAEATKGVEPVAPVGPAAARPVADAAAVPSVSTPEVAVAKAGQAPLAAPAPEAASALSPSAPRVVAVPSLALREGSAGASPATQRAGQDPTATLPAASLQTVDRGAVAANAAQAAQRPGAAAEAVQVVAPDAAMARASHATASLAPVGSREDLPSPSPRVSETAVPTLHDVETAAAAAPGANAPRSGRDVAAVAALAAEATQGAGPVAPVGPLAARPVADAGAVPSVSTPEVAVAKAGQAPLAAPAPEAASALSPSAPRVVAVPSLALREGSAAAAPVAKRREAGAAPAAPLTPVAATAAGPSASAANPTPRGGDTIGAHPEPTAPLVAPGSGLLRAGQSPAAPPSPPTAPLAAAASSQRPKAAPQALRDEATAEPARPQRAASTAGKAVAPVTSALDVRVQEPRASAVERPSRGTAGASVVALPGVSPPSSLLERGVQTTLPRGPQEIAAAPSAYSNRFGPAKKKALEQFGGSVETERAVANGLRYLASIQKPEGIWGDREMFDDKYGQLYVGKTALCVLAFLGAGHTPASGSEHSKVVAKALEYLLALQDEDTGAFGMSSSYGHGIATYAVAECYGLTKAPQLRRPLEAALAWILQHQGPRRDKRNRGGWGYYSPGLQPEDDYARVSVTSWMVMALESARMSGIDLPPEVLPRAREYLEQSFDQPNGWFRYNHKPSRLQSAWPTLPASTPAGAFCLMLLGAPADDRMVQTAVDYTVQRRPEAYRRYDDDDFVLRGQGNVYFWYYGTLCTFLAGGEAWERWNERLRAVLPAAQAADGSFPPIDVYAREAGDTRADRSYSTSMCVLSLEVYYRYFTPLLLGR